MDTAELIGWTALAISFAGVFGIFATRRALRRLGILTMRGGLTVFVLIALHTLLEPVVAGNPALAFTWIPIVVATILAVSWLTRYFYRDVEPHDVKDAS